jgi:predicted nucleic acid-binding protein
MTDKYFVDTNVLVYAHDSSSATKHSRAQEIVKELWNSRRGVISTQVLQELCIHLRRRSANAPHAEKTQQLISAYLDWQVVVNTGPSVLRALALEERYKVSFWDALILQAAEKAEVSVLLSEDLSAGQRYCGFVVENPFAGLV